MQAVKDMTVAAWARRRCGVEAMAEIGRGTLTQGKAPPRPGIPAAFSEGVKIAIEYVDSTSEGV
jgi:hypothetical protein